MLTHARGDGEALDRLALSLELRLEARTQRCLLREGCRRRAQLFVQNGAVVACERQRGLERAHAGGEALNFDCSLPQQHAGALALVDDGGARVIQRRATVEEVASHALELRF